LASIGFPWLLLAFGEGPPWLFRRLTLAFVGFRALEPLLLLAFKEPPHSKHERWVSAERLYKTALSGPLQNLDARAAIFYYQL
jgi:hypothetical protein